MIKKLILFTALLSSNIFAENTTMILPVAAGGLINRYAILMEPVLSKGLNSSVIIDFKPGAQGLIGARALADIKTDKLVLLMGPAQSIDSWSEFKTQKMVNIMTDITPIAFLGTIPGVIVTNSNKFTNFKEMVMLFRNVAKKYTSLENMQEIPYKSTSAVSVDALSGILDFGVIGTYGMVSQYIDNKKLYPLAVFSTNRSKFLPNVPTLQEAGLGTTNEFKYYNNIFLWANKNADPEEIKKLKKYLKEFYKSKESKNIYDEMDLQFGGKNVDTPEIYLKAFLQND